MTDDVLDLVSAIGPRWTGPGDSVADGMPIGNGNLVALVWVDHDGDLRMRLALNDSWDENARSIGLANARLRIEGAPLAAGAFEQRLDYALGRVVVTGGDPEVLVTVWSDAGEPTLHIEVEQADPRHVEFGIERWRTETVHPTVTQWQDFIHTAATTFGDRPGTPTVLSADRVIETPDAVVVVHRSETSCWAATGANQSVPLDGIRDPFTKRTSGLVARSPQLTSGGAELLVSDQPSATVRIDVTAMTRVCDDVQEWIDEAMATTDRVLATPIESLRAGHEAYWRGFWERGHVFVGGDPDADAVTRGWFAARWLMAAQGRSEGAIEFNGGAFTFRDDHKLWHDYTQYNQRFAYWSMLAAGDLGLMDAYFRVAVDAIPVSRAKSRAMWGHDGVMLPEHMILGGFQSGSHYGWDRSGRTPDELHDEWTRRLYGGTPEIAVMMLDRYLYAPDPAFAADVLLPFAGGVLEWYDRHWAREDGRMVISPAYSGEHDRDVRNPIADVAALTRLVHGLRALPLGTAEERAGWSRLAEELPSIGIREGRIATADDVEIGLDTNNQNLFPVWPFRLFGAGEPSWEVAEQTYLERRGKSGVDDVQVWRFDAVVAAHLGLVDEARQHVLTAFTYRPFRYEGFTDGEPDGEHAIERPAIGASALQAMLVRPAGDRIQVLAAWPPEWSVRFRLWAPGETVVEGEYVPGVAPAIRVSPEARTGDLVVVDPGHTLEDGAVVQLRVGYGSAVGPSPAGPVLQGDADATRWRVEVAGDGITLLGDDGGVLDVEDADGGPAGPRRRWRVERVSEGAVVLHDAATDRCLTADRIERGAGFRLEPRSSSPRQRIRIEPA